jgi:hypothetical protein
VRSGRKTPEQAVGPLGLFGGTPDDAAHQKELRIVAAMPLGIERFQLSIPLENFRRPRLDQYPRGPAIRAAAIDLFRLHLRLPAAAAFFLPVISAGKAMQ